MSSFPEKSLAGLVKREYALRQSYVFISEGGLDLLLNNDTQADCPIQIQLVGEAHP